MIYDILWYMMIYDDIWWYMMMYDDVWWYMMIYDDICWWYMICVKKWGHQAFPLLHSNHLPLTNLRCYGVTCSWTPELWGLQGVANPAIATGPNIVELKWWQTVPANIHLVSRKYCTPHPLEASPVCPGRSFGMTYPPSSASNRTRRVDSGSSPSNWFQSTPGQINGANRDLMGCIPDAFQFSPMVFLVSHPLIVFDELEPTNPNGYTI